MQKECIGVHTLLWYLIFSGCMIAFVLRLTINIAIVDMVAVSPKMIDNYTTESSKLTNSSGIPRNDSKESLHTGGGKFHWNENEQSMVLGAFFWSLWISQIPGGVLSQRSSPKMIVGISNLLLSITAIMTPWAAYLHLYALISLRFVQGIIGGLTSGAITSIIAKWVAPNDRSKFLNAVAGTTIGAVSIYFSGGYLIAFFGWEYIFYISGACGMLWFVAWHFLIYDSPAEHPRISLEVRKAIESSLGEDIKRKNLEIPWIEILRSRALWMIVMANFSSAWGYFMLITLSPTYYKHIHGLDVRMVGLLSGLPQLTRLLFSLPYSAMSDHLLHNKIVSRTNVRKMAIFISSVLPGTLFFGLALSGSNFILAVILITTAATLNGAFYAGAYASMVDIAPNFAGITSSLSLTLAGVSGIIVTTLAGYLTVDNQTVSQWQLLFFISGCVTVFCGCAHLFFGSADVQWWNEPKTTIVEETPLKPRNEMSNGPDEIG